VSVAGEFVGSVTRYPVRPPNVDGMGEIDSGTCIPVVKLTVLALASPEVRNRSPRHAFQEDIKPPMVLGVMTV